MIRGTSHAAGKAMRGRAPALRAQVFAFLLGRDREGATLEEIEEALKMPGNTVRPRRIELEELGFVEDSGARRPTHSGKMAIVWVVPESVAEKARRKLERKGVTL